MSDTIHTIVPVPGGFKATWGFEPTFDSGRPAHDWTTEALTPQPLFDYYRGCCLDEGSFVDYALYHFDWPSRSWWMIPGTWKDEG